MKTMKRVCALLLAFSMVLSVGTVGVAAAAENDLLTTDFSLAISEVDKTLTVALNCSKDISGFNSGSGDMSIKDSSGNDAARYFTLTTITAGELLDMTKVINTSHWGASAEDYENGDSMEAGTWVTYTYTVSDVIPDDTYTFTMTLGDDFSDIEWQMYSCNEGVVTANYVVGNPAEDNSTGYEIYYTLDKAVDGTNAGFKAYDVEDEVVATVYLVNKGEDAINLQAYDIYLDYDSALIYQGTTLQGAIAYKADGSDDDSLEDVAKAEDKVIHIQAVGDNDKIIETLAAGTPVELGTITFSIDGDTAVYGTKMPITLTQTGSGKETTNIAVGGETEGDKESHYPTVTQTVTDAEGNSTTYKGAEVNTKHKVTFDTNEGSEVAEQQIGHNKSAEKPEDPTKANHTFAGWYADENLTTAYTFTEKVTADTTIYAKWEATAYTVNWYGANNELIYTETIDSGTTTSFNETSYSKPTKAPDEQYTYGFKGWTTDDTPELNGSTETFPYTITAPTNFYPVFSTTTVEYEVKYMPETGDTALHTEMVAYGSNPTWTAGKATKTGDTQYSYEFLGWTETENPGFEATVIDFTTFEVKKATTFYPVFKQVTNSYTVTYDPGQNGAFDTEDAKTETVPYGSTPENVPTVNPNAGYEFTGWSDGETTYKSDLSDYTVEGEKTLTAQYKGKEITVKFNGNGADANSPPMENKTWTYGTEFEMPANSFVKTGWDFNGWNTQADGEGTSYTAGQKYTDLTTENEITLFAQWKQADYTVNYATDLTGGSVSGETAANYQEEITVTVTPLPGYNVGEVTYTPDGSKAQIIEPNEDDEYIFSMPNANVDVTATFTAISYNVTVDEAVKDNVFVNKQAATVEDTITVTVTAPDGYDIETVTYVNTDDENAAPVEITAQDGAYKFPMQPYNVTVTATFKAKSYTIHYDSNTGSGTTSDTTATFGTEATLAENAFTKTGYDFKGWSTTTDGEAVTSFNPTTYAESYTLYAVWEAKKVNVTLDHNYEGSTNGSITVTYDGTYENLTTPTRTGYDFDGWYESTAEDAAKVMKETKVTKDSEHTLYAKWTAQTYQVTLDPKNGTINSGNITGYTYGVGATLPTDVTRPGYTFDGWKDAEGNTATTIPETAIGDKTFTAQWTLDTYTVTLIPAGGTVADNTWSLNADGNYTKTYTIESGITLPTATKGMYTFGGWNLDKEAGSWKNGSPYEAKEYNDSRWGNVTLTAVWESAASYAVESYLYARTDWFMLRVANDLNDGEVYQFNGETMYYIEDPGYAVEGSGKPGTFYTLIEAKYVEDNKLTAAAYELLQPADATARATINYNGDINDDKVVNVADANIVYQMVKLEDGNYYSEAQLTVEQRLAADMHKEAYKVGEYRGNAEDVNAIVKLINTKTN